MLMLQHPEAAHRPCEECQRWMYHEGKDKLGTQRVIGRDGQPLTRAKNVPTPCWLCPKKSPTEAKRIELSDKNWRTWQVYQEVQATGGACLSERERADGMLAANLGIVYEAVQSVARAQQELQGLLIMAALGVK